MTISGPTTLIGVVVLVLLVLLAIYIVRRI
jgi:hypothetical protein